MNLPKLTRRNKVLLLLGLIVLLIPAFYVYDYTQNNPVFCTSCHLMNPAFDTWSVSAMHDLSCHKCHETDMATSLGHVVKVISSNPSTVDKEVEIKNSLCENCHASNDPKWIQVADTAGHKVHIFDSTSNANCIDCHGKRLHVFIPPEEVCMSCHDIEKTEVKELMGTHCTQCHVFTAKDQELIPGEKTCLTCHENKEFMGKTFPEEAHSNVICTDCHNPHEENIFPDCTSCHESGGALHSLPSHEECISCHIPHSDKNLRENCLSCHDDKTNHFAPVECSSCHAF